MSCPYPGSRERRATLEPEYLTVWEAALVLAIDERTVRRLCNRGQLAHERLSDGPKGQLRIRRPAPGERWIHAAGTFPSYLETTEGIKVKRRQAKQARTETSAGVEAR